jgi:adenylosuccinate lyase
MPYGSKKQKSNKPRCKSVEYFIKDKFEKLGLSQYKEFIHFGLTSQDINNTAIPLSPEAFESVYMPSLIELVAKLKELSIEWANIPLLAHTRATLPPYSLR